MQRAHNFAPSELGLNIPHKTAHVPSTLSQLRSSTRKWHDATSRPVQTHPVPPPHPHYSNSPAQSSPAANGAGGVEARDVGGGMPLSSRQASPQAAAGVSTSARRRHPMINVSNAPTLSVPWHQRRTAKPDASESCWCLGSKYLLARLEFAFRVALFAVLPAASLIVNDSTRPSFLTRSLATTFAALTARETIGGSLMIVSDTLKSIAMWLPLSTAAAALRLHDYMVAWWIVYVLATVAMGVLSEGFCRKLGLLSFTLCMLAQLGTDDRGKEVDYPARLCVDELIGAAFGLLASALPPFRTSSKVAQTALEQAFDDISVCYSGLSEAFWAPTNLNRSVDVAKIKFAMSQMQEAILRCAEALQVAEYEHFGASRALVDMRMRVDLCRELVYSLNSLLRAVEIVEATPEMVEHSENAIKFAEFMRQPLIDVAAAADTLLQSLSRPGDNRQLRQSIQAAEHINELENASFSDVASAAAQDCTARGTKAGGDVEELVAAAASISPRCGIEQQLLCHLLAVHQHMEDMFVHSRREIFYRHNLLKRVEDYHMCNGFFMFHHRLVVRALAAFVERRRNSEVAVRADCCGGAGQQLWTFFTTAPRSFVASIRTMLGRRQTRVVKEALKTSLALVLSVLFFLQYEPNTAVISGPSVVALVSGANTGEAMHASMMRLIGTLFGAVMGFFATSLSANPWHIVIGITSIVLIFSFFRTGQRYGGAAFYACFVSIAVAVPNQTSEAAMRRVQQNTFAITIYVVVANLIFPKVPSRVLRSLRAQSLKETCNSCTLLLSRYNWFEQLHEKEMAAAARGGLLNVSAAAVRERHERWIGECEAQIKNLAGLLARAKVALPLASEEPSLRRRPFPASIAKDFSVTKEKFAALLTTMLAAWRVMLLEADPNDHQRSLKRIAATVAPRVREFCTTIADAFNMIIVVVSDPHASLTAELTRCTLQARQQALDILATQRCAMLEMISEVGGFETPLSEDDVCAPFSTDASRAPQRAAAQQANAPFDDPTEDDTGECSSWMGSSAPVNVGVASDAVKEFLADTDSEVVDAAPGAMGERQATLPPAAAAAPSSPRSTPRPLPTAVPQTGAPTLMRLPAATARGVTLAEVATPGALTSHSQLLSFAAATQQPPAPPSPAPAQTMLADGPLPISSLDAAALHTMTLCCISIAFELRKLFVLAEALQHDEVASIGY